MDKIKMVLAALAAGALTLVAGCNTVAGAGEDLQAGGKAIEKAADKSAPK
jgi:entericidin B